MADQSLGQAQVALRRSRHPFYTRKRLYAHRLCLQKPRIAPVSGPVLNRNRLTVPSPAPSSLGFLD